MRFAAEILLVINIKLWIIKPLLHVRSIRQNILLYISAAEHTEYLLWQLAIRYFYATVQLSVNVR